MTSTSTSITNDPHKPGLGYGAAILLPGLTSLLATPLLGHVDLVNIVPLFLIGVVVTSVRWGQGPGVVASIVSVLCFDFFFVPPRFSLSVDESASLITFGVMLGVSLLLSHLTGAIRAQAVAAEMRASEANMLHALARELTGAVTLADVEARLNAALKEYVGVTARLLLPDTQHKLHGLDGGHEAVMDLERLIANGVWATGRSLPANPDLRDDAMTLLIPLPGEHEARGVLVLHEPKVEPLRELPDTLCAAIAALVAVALARIELVQGTGAIAGSAPAHS
jgi:two-component system sensor histidine kinase KdpD